MIPLPKKFSKESCTRTGKNDENRRTQILNLIFNTSFLLMAVMTEAFSEMFTHLSKQMITALTPGRNTNKESTQTIDELQRSLPHHFRTELITMRNDLTKQLKEKRQELGTLLDDPRFDIGITIVKRTPLSLPQLTQQLDERSLLGYLALLQINDPRLTAMFQELLEWMNTLPQPSMKKKEIESGYE